MNLKEAIRLVHDDLGIGYPIYAIETNKYFVLTMADNNWNAIGNNSTFVIDKEKREGKWLPLNTLRSKGLDDDGDLFREYDEQDIRRAIR